MDVKKTQISSLRAVSEPQSAQAPRRDTSSNSTLLKSQPPSDAVLLSQSDESRSARRLNDGISVAQVASITTTEVVKVVKEMREVALKAARSKNDDSALAQSQTDFQKLAKRVDRVANSGDFSAVKVGQGEGRSFEVNDARGAQVAVVQLRDLRSTAIGLDAQQVDLGTVHGAKETVSRIDSILKELDTLNSTQKDAASTLETAVKTPSFEGGASNKKEFLAEEAARRVRGRMKRDSVLLIRAQSNISDRQKLVLLKQHRG